MITILPKDWQPRPGAEQHSGATNAVTGLLAGGLQVLEALVRLLGADGRLDPSHSFLARLAAVHEATVRRALDRLRALGPLDWTRRLVRGEGWRVEQTSNAYWLTPERKTPAFVCDVQTARAVKLTRAPGPPAQQRAVPRC